MTYFDLMFALVAVVSLAVISLVFIMNDGFASAVLSLALGN